jgi:hypothetical protein
VTRGFGIASHGQGLETMPTRSRFEIGDRGEPCASSEEFGQEHAHLLAVRPRPRGGCKRCLLYEPLCPRSTPRNAHPSTGGTPCSVALCHSGSSRSSRSD